MTMLVCFSFFSSSLPAQTKQIWVLMNHKSLKTKCFFINIFLDHQIAQYVEKCNLKRNKYYICCVLFLVD